MSKFFSFVLFLCSSCFLQAAEDGRSSPLKGRVSPTSVTALHAVYCKNDRSFQKQTSSQEHQPQIPCFKNEPSLELCSLCAGLEKIACDSCEDGTLRVFPIDPDWVREYKSYNTCSHCKGTRMMPCSLCVKEKRTLSSRQKLRENFQKRNNASVAVITEGMASLEITCSYSGVSGKAPRKTHRKHRNSPF